MGTAGSIGIIKGVYPDGTVLIDYRPLPEYEPGTNILLEANKATRTEREIAYAHPMLNFARIAKLWDTYLRMVGVIGGNKPLTPEHVAQMMVLFKIAREVATHYLDSLIDEAGYTDCAQRIDTVLKRLGHAKGLNDLRDMTLEQLDALYMHLEKIPMTDPIYQNT